MKETDYITQSISVARAAERYGIPRNRAGYAICPFHSEGTPSLRIYDEPERGFYCFGCHKGGDVIRFVQLLFSLDFRQAIQRLKTDFMLISADTETLRREQCKWEVVRKRKEQEKQRLESDWKEAAGIHCRLIWEIKTLEPMSDGWAKAAHSLTYYGLLLEILADQLQDNKNLRGGGNDG